MSKFVETGFIAYSLPQKEKNVNILYESIERCLKQFSNIELFQKILLLEKRNKILNNFLDLLLNSQVQRKCFISNISLKSQSKERTLLIRLVDIEELRGLLPDNVSFSLLGKVFLGNAGGLNFSLLKINISHNDDCSINDEKESLINFYSLKSLNQFSNINGEINGFKNILTINFIEQLPNLALETEVKLEQWSKYLKFKENLIYSKIVGVKYYFFEFLQEQGQMKFYLVAKNKEQLNKVYYRFLNQNLSIYDTDISQDEIEFKFTNKSFKNIRSKFIDLENFTQKEDFQYLTFEEHLSLINKYSQMIDKNYTNKNYCYASINLDLSEEFLNYFNNKKELSPEVSDLVLFRQCLNKKSRNKKFAQDGFICVSAIGDLILLQRHKAAIRDLKENKNCISANLTSYLFDINNARLPKEIISLEQNQLANKELNEKQKLAVEKILSAPDICLIQGPPGTGKTTVIAEAIYQLTKQNKRVLLSSQSHDAIDNALSAIKVLPQIRIARLANNSSKIDTNFNNSANFSRYYDSLYNVVPEIEYYKYANQINNYNKKIEKWNDDFFEKFAINYNNSAKITLKFCHLETKLNNLNKVLIKEQDNYQKQFDFIESHKLKQKLLIEWQKFFEQLFKDFNCNNFNFNFNLSNLDLELIKNNKFPVEIEKREFLKDLYKLINNIGCIDYTYKDLEINPQLKVKFIFNLLEIIKDYYSSYPIIENDYNYLKSLNLDENFDISSLKTKEYSLQEKMQIQQLNQTIKKLEQELEEGEDVLTQWRQAKEQLKAYKKHFLQNDCYNSFENIKEILDKPLNCENLIKIRDELEIQLLVYKKISKTLMLIIMLGLENISIFLNNSKNKDFQLYLTSLNDKKIIDILKQIDNYEKQFYSDKDKFCDSLELLEKNISELKVEEVSVCFQKYLSPQIKEHEIEIQNKQEQILLNIQKLKQCVKSLDFNFFKENKDINLDPKINVKLYQLFDKIDDLFNICQYHFDLTKRNLYSFMEKYKLIEPLLFHWRSLLAQKEEFAKNDEKILAQNYIKNANLIAISCNENETTLANNGIDSYFDYVIIDEVSKATPIELLLPLMRAQKAVLVGDHRQLPPLMQENNLETFQELAQINQENSDIDPDSLITMENYYKYEDMLSASLFKQMFENANESIKQRLNIQFRMHPDIMKIINNFYENTLICGNPDKDRKHYLNFINNNSIQPQIYLNEKNHMLWIDTTKDVNNQYYLATENNINKVEAQLIAKTVIDINNQLEKQGFKAGNKMKIGICSFYVLQCKQIRKELRKLNPKYPKFSAIEIEINTVIKYQGKEKPIMLLSLVKNNGKENKFFKASKANISRFEFINVAMSRAQNLLLVFGARNMLENREIELPKMDNTLSSKEFVYRRIFNKLDLNEQGKIISANAFNSILSINKPNNLKNY